MRHATTKNIIIMIIIIKDRAARETVEAVVKRKKRETERERERERGDYK